LFYLTLFTDYFLWHQKHSRSGRWQSPWLDKDTNLQKDDRITRQEWLTTDYCLKRNINNFGLRELFYFRQGHKNTCYSSTCTNYKGTNNTELIIEKVMNVYTQGYYIY